MISKIIDEDQNKKMQEVFEVEQRSVYLIREHAHIFNSDAAISYFHRV